MRDALNEHEAHLDVTLFGFIPVAHGASSPALIRAELMRYLAELAWIPDAIIFNNGLPWRVDGPDTFAVGAGIGTRAAKVIWDLILTDGLRQPLLPIGCVR